MEPNSMNKFEHPKHAFQTSEIDGKELRDWFAGIVLSEYLAKGLPNNSEESKCLAEVAYDIADAMLEARKQDGGA